MAETCPIPTPEQKHYAEIQSRLETSLLRTVYAALQDATNDARTEIENARLEMPPPPYGYFAAKVYQHLYCTLCGANPETFADGNAETADAIIRNGRNIAEHYWGLKKA